MDNPISRSVERRHLREIMSVMARELGVLVNDGRKIEDAVGDTLGRFPDGVLESGIVESLQGLDYMVQAMEELSLILQRLADDIDADILVDFDNSVSRFKLRALFQAFSGGEVRDLGRDHWRHTGSVELF